MAKIAAISNQKGGVGKTTVAVNLGKNLAHLGKRVLLIDNDPQANLSLSVLGESVPQEIISYNEEGKSLPGVSNTYQLYSEDSVCKPLKINEHLSIIGTSKHLSEISTKPFEVIFEFKEKVFEIKDQYDFIIIDCLPSFGTLQTAAHMTASHLLIPTHLDDFSVSGINEQMKTAKNTKKHLNPDLSFLGIITNEVSSQKVLVEDHFQSELKEKYGDYLFKTKITKSAKVKESHAMRQSIAEYKINSNQAKQYMNLTQEFLDRILDPKKEGIS